MVVATLWYLAAALAILACGFAVTVNGDIWFHLAAGQLIWQQRSVPAIDTWSYTTAGRTWFNHEWLSDLIFHGWSQAFGLESLIIWQWLLLLATFLLLFRVLHRLSSSYLWSFLALVLSLQVGAPFFEIRPAYWSLLGFVLVLQLALLRDGPLWILPVLFALWANLHGGVVFGLAALALLLGFGLLAPADPADQPGGMASPSRKRRLVIVGAASLGATLLNPYGLTLLTFPLHLVLAGSAARARVIEWLSPFVAGGVNSPLYPWAIAAFVAAAVVLLSRGLSEGRGRRLSWSALAPLTPLAPLAPLAIAALCLAMSLQSRRFITVFAIALGPVIALAGAALRRRRGRDARPLAARAALALPMLAILAGMVRLWSHPWSTAAFRYTTLSYTMPIDTLNFVEANQLRGNVLAHFLYGGYVDYRTRGRLKVFVDSRLDTVFDDATLRDYYRIQDLAPGWEQALERSAAQWVLWPDQTPEHLVRRLEESGRWRRVHGDRVSVLLARADLPLPEPLRPAPESPYRDWAAAQEAYAAHDLAEVERLLRHALAALPDLAPACEDLANLQQRLGQSEAASRTAERCRALYAEQGFPSPSRAQ